MNRKLLRRRPRDSQRQRLYDAERDTKAWRRKSDYFDSLADVARYATDVMLDPWTVEIYGRETLPEILTGRDNQFARGGSRKLVFPKWAWFKLVILHEIAHSLTLYKFDHSIAYHGPEFCWAFMELVERFMPTDAPALTEAYAKHRIKVLPFFEPRKAA